MVAAIQGSREESVDPTRRHVLRLTTGAAALCGAIAHRLGQAYPNRPVKWVVGFAPAGGNDITPA